MRIKGDSKRLRVRVAASPGDRIRENIRSRKEARAAFTCLEKRSFTVAEKTEESCGVEGRESECGKGVNRLKTI